MSADAPPTEEDRDSSAAESPAHELTDLLALLDGIPFEVDTASLEVTLRGAGAKRLLDQPADERLPASFWNRLLPTPERERVMTVLFEVAQDGKPRTVEHLARGAGPLDRKLRTAVRREDEGRLVGVMLDVSPAWAHERQWRELEAWLAALGESLPFDFWICDRFGRMVLLSPSFASRWDGAPGMGLEQLKLPPDLMLSWRQSLNRALRGEVVHEQLRVPGPSGSVVAISRAVAPVRENGEICGALGVDMDVTSLHEAERQVRQSMAELTRAQDDLVHRQQLAALGEMAAVVAHEVRNPLAAICNATALLRRGEATGANPMELVSILEEETFRLEQLVRNLLELARPHRPELREQPLAPVVAAILEEGTRYAISPIQVHLDGVLRASPMRLYLDEQRLSLALVNIVRNAVQAMYRGGELHVDGGQVDEEGASWAWLAIRDTGEGMTEATLARIFEPFFTTRSTGSGMGLVIAKRILMEHGGKLEVTSRLGHGTTVTLKLPLRHDPEQDDLTQ